MLKKYFPAKKYQFSDPIFLPRSVRTCKVHLVGSDPVSPLQIPEHVAEPLWQRQTPVTQLSVGQHRLRRSGVENLALSLQRLWMLEERIFI